MSFDAVNWALKRSKSSGNDRLVLIILAQFASDEDDGWYTRSSLAAQANVSIPTVPRALARLKALGEIDYWPGSGRTRSTFKIIRDQGDQIDTPASGDTPPVSLSDTPQVSDSDTPPGSGVIPQERKMNEPDEQALNKDSLATIGFEQFWTHYRSECRSDGKANAKKAWAKTQPADREVAFEALKYYAARCRSTDTPFCHGSTYLNQQRYEDFVNEAGIVGSIVDRQSIQALPAGDKAIAHALTTRHTEAQQRAAARDAALALPSYPNTGLVPPPTM